MSKQPGSQSRAVCSLTDLSKVGSATGPQIVTLQSSPWFLLNYSAFSALPASRPLLPPLLSLFYPVMIWWEDWAITGFHKSLFTQNISWDKSFQWLHWRLSNFTDGKVSRRSFLNILLTLPTLCPRLPRSHCWVWNYFLWELFLQKKRNEEKQSEKQSYSQLGCGIKSHLADPELLRRWTVWIPKLSLDL